MPGWRGCLPNVCWRADNAASLRLFGSLGFAEGPAELARALALARAGRPDAGEWVVVERVLALPPRPPGAPGGDS